MYNPTSPCLTLNYMKRLLILALAAAACASHATVVYDNGAPNQADGNEMTLWRQSEDITNTGTNVFNTLVFWTASSGANIHSLDMQLSLDNAGNPGPAVLDFQGAITSIATGNNVQGLTEYKNTFTFSDVFASGNFVYHIALLGNYEELAQNFDGVYWETTNGNGTATGRESVNDLQNNWADNQQEHAFRLEENVTPEPMSMLALGLGAAAMIRRRKASK